MSQGFKLKFDQMRESNPAKQDAGTGSPSKAYDEFYPEAGNTRNLCFVWRDGRRTFINYSYLISAEYLPDESCIVLTFTSQTLVLKGVNLEPLFYELMHQSVRQITCTDERYNVVSEEGRFAVNEIVSKQ